MRLINCFVESETCSDFFVGRITHHCTAATDQNRQVFNRERKVIEYCLNLRVTLGIDVGIRLVISCQKLFDAKRVKRMAGANKNDVTNFASNQFQTTQDESLQKDITELAVSFDEALQCFAVDLNEFGLFRGPYAYEST